MQLLGAATAAPRRFVVREAGVQVNDWSVRRADTTVDDLSAAYDVRVAEHLALANPLLALPSKRDLLLFDRIAMMGFRKILRDWPVEQTRDLQFLAEKGVIIEPTTGATEDPDYLRAETQDAPAAFTSVLIVRTLKAVRSRESAVHSLVSRAALRRIAREVTLPPHTDVEASVHQALRTLRAFMATNPSPANVAARELATLNAVNILIARSAAHNMRVVTGTRVTPLLPQNFIAAEAERTAMVANIVIDCLRVPSDEVPLDDILRFRENEDGSRALRRLHAWMGNAAHGDKSADVLNAELDALIDTYSEHMRLAKMKTQTGGLETFFTTAADVIGDVAKLNLGNAVRALFAVRQRRIGLLEAELNAPGREVAYITQAREQFTAGA